jgi:protein BCP1
VQTKILTFLVILGILAHQPNIFSRFSSSIHPPKIKMSGKTKRERNGSDGEEDGYSTSSSYAPSAIDVSFNYVAPTEIDFMALKRLIQQLYHTHSSDIDLGPLSDHIIQIGKQELGDAAIGTVVKVEDDEDGDPFAFASALYLSSKENQASKTLLSYYNRVLTTSSSSSSKVAASSISSLLQSKDQKVLQIFHERMINMPPQIMPPLYKMLFEEIQSNEQTPTHLLFFSRVFSTEAFSDGEEEEDQIPPSSKIGNGKQKGKKAKKTKPLNKAITKMSTGTNAEEEVGLFHPEDAFIANHALHTFTFRFPAVKDSDDSFNAPMYGRIAIVKNDPQTLQKLLDEMNTAFAIST